MSRQQTIAQEQANMAWKQTEKLKVTDEYLSLVRGAATLIMMNGLGQTLAFYLSKKDHHKTLAENLAGWLLRDAEPESNRTANLLMRRIMDQDSNAYRTLTAEALAFVNWLKRFAEAKDKAAEDEQVADTTNQVGEGDA